MTETLLTGRRPIRTNRPKVLLGERTVGLQSMLNVRSLFLSSLESSLQ